jgi:hypothetical protein
MIKQTALRRIRIGTRGATQHASFVFPFFDGALHVRLVLASTSAGHVVLQDKLRWARRGLLVSLDYIGRRPLALDDVQPDVFHRLFHFDPWWTMRVAREVQPATRSAIIGTNLADRRRGHLVIRDLVFDDDLERVETVLVGDGVFRAVPYGPTKPMPQTLQDTFFGRMP